MDDCIKVALHQGSDAVYMDLEDDGTLLLESLQAQFDGAIGLRYSFVDGYRSIRVRNGVLLEPKAGWQDSLYLVVTSATSAVEPDTSARSVENKVEVGVDLSTSPAPSGTPKRLRRGVIESVDSGSSIAVEIKSESAADIMQDTFKMGEHQICQVTVCTCINCVNLVH